MIPQILLSLFVQLMLIIRSPLSGSVEYLKIVGTIATSVRVVFVYWTYAYGIRFSRQNSYAMAVLTRQLALCCIQLLQNWKLRLWSIAACLRNMSVRRKLHQTCSLQVTYSCSATAINSDGFFLGKPRLADIFISSFPLYLLMLLISFICFSN